MSLETRTLIEKNLHVISKKIEAFAIKHHRKPNDIRLLAVSKTKPAEAVKTAYDIGIRDFGENYLQDALSKIAILPDDISWHFIGAIQSNKTKLIAENFAWVHTVSTLKVVERLNRQRPESLPPLNICLQININQESNKSGIDTQNKKDLESLIERIRALPNLRLRGLMCIPEATQYFEKQCQNFATLKIIFERLNQKLSLEMDTLSMGMSGDLEAAIKESSTMVRIGTDIFGKRLF